MSTEAAQSGPADMELEGKVALITGGAQGIGLTIAKHLLRNGVKVSIVDIEEDTGKSACVELQKEYPGGKVKFITCDVTNKEQLRDAFQRTKDEFGCIDIVCNNAGITNEEQWRKMVDINVYAVIEGTYLAIEYLSTKKGGKGGVVINMASLAGVYSVPRAPVYCATKHAVVGFTRSLKPLLETDGVRVNCMCPTFVDTRMVREGLDKADDPGIKQYILDNMITTDKVAEGTMELITNASKSGAVMAAMKDKMECISLLGDEKS